MEDALQRERDLRRVIRSQLLAKHNEILDLMKDDGNLGMIKTELCVEFGHLFGEICDLNIFIKR